MKFSKLDDQKLVQVLLLAPVAALQNKQSMVKDAILDMNNSSEDSLEVEYINDLFSLSTDKIIDKWFGGQEDIAGIFFKEE